MDRIVPSHRGFTVVEITAVILIAGLLALAVIPAMDRFDDASRGAGIAEAARLLTFARERAIASGIPVGVRFDAAAHTAQLLTIGDDGRPEPLTDALGSPSTVLSFRDTYRNEVTRITVPTELVHGAVAIDTVTIWFDHRGTPHARSTSGSHAGGLTSSASIRFLGDAQVTVHARSGLVEGP